MAVAQIGALISFVSGTTAVAADVNTNFTDVRNAFNNLVDAANSINVNIIAEVTAAAGVTVDGVLLKDALVGATYGGTGASDPTAKGALIAQGSNPMTTVAPGSANNVLLSDGTDWTSGAQAGPAGNVALLDAANVFSVAAQKITTSSGTPAWTLDNGTQVVAFQSGSFPAVGTTSTHDFHLKADGNIAWKVLAASPNAFVPVSNNVTDLGSTSLAIRTIYCASSIHVDDGTNELRVTSDRIGTESNHDFELHSNSLVRWKIEAAGTLVPATDSTYDIGAAAAAIRAIYLDRIVQVATNTSTSNNYAPDATIGYHFVDRNVTTHTMDNPTNGVEGAILIITQRTGSNSCTVTWGSEYEVQGVSPNSVGLNTSVTSIFRRVGSVWRQIGGATGVG